MLCMSHALCCMTLFLCTIILIHGLHCSMAFHFADDVFLSEEEQIEHTDPKSRRSNNTDKSHTKSNKRNKYGQLEDDSLDVEYHDHDPDLRLHRTRHTDYEPIDENEVLNFEYAYDNSAFKDTEGGGEFERSASIEIIPVVGTRMYHNDADYLGPRSRKPDKIEILKALDDLSTRRPHAYIKPNSHDSSADDTPLVQAEVYHVHCKL